MLKISRLTKSFGGVDALRDVSFAVASGERVALLGHNGAGKSTAMKLILGLLDCDSGDISVCGAPPGSNAARAQVAYLPENASFHPALTGLEQLSFYLRLRGLNPKGASEILARVGLKDAALRRIGTYSKGMRQRVGLAQALIGQPRLLVLDEPTSGLDPVSRHDFYEILDALAADGAAILLSSHALTEVEARTDRLLILSQGQIVAEGALADLRREAAQPVAIYITAPAPAILELSAAFPTAARTSQGLRLTCTQQEKLPVLAKISEFRNLISDVDLIPPSLEDIYTHYNGRDAR